MIGGNLSALSHERSFSHAGYFRHFGPRDDRAVQFPYSGRRPHRLHCPRPAGYADLLLHVIDVSNPEWREQARIVDELIRELGAEGIPCIRVYNKCDAAFTAQQEREKDAVYISARTGEGIPALLEAVDKRLDKGTKRVVIHLPYDKAGLLDGLYREAKVEGVEYGETVDVTAVCTPRIMGRLKAYIEGWVEPKEDWE